MPQQRKPISPIERVRRCFYKKASAAFLYIDAIHGKPVKVSREELKALKRLYLEASADLAEAKRVAYCSDNKEAIIGTLPASSGPVP